MAQPRFLLPLPKPDMKFSPHPADRKITKASGQATASTKASGQATATRWSLRSRVSLRECVFGVRRRWV